MSESYNTTEQQGFNFYYNGSSQSGVPLGPVIFSHSSGSTYLGLNTKVGVKLPRHRAIIRARGNATTNLVATFFDYDYSFWEAFSHGQAYLQINNRLSEQWDFTQSGVINYPVSPAQTGPPASVIADVHNRCIAKFIDEVNAAQSSENLTGRSIKHFKHDVHSLLHPMVGIQSKISSYLTSLEKVRYGKLRGASLRSTITQAYLEFKFGVQPFVTDVTDIMTDMVIKDRNRNPSVPISATAKALYSGSNVLHNVPNPGPLLDMTPQFYVRSTSEYSEKMKGAVYSYANNISGQISAVQSLRLTPNDFLPTVFSILPYAWMVNYFTNIREIIDAASFRTGSLVWGCFNTRVTNTVDYGNVFFHVQNPGNLGGPPYYNYVYSSESYGGNATFTYKQLTRSALSPADLIPSFEIKFPTTSTPWLNMMAAFAPRIYKIVSSFT